MSGSGLRPIVPRDRVGDTIVFTAAPGVDDDVIIEGTEDGTRRPLPGQVGPLITAGLSADRPGVISAPPLPCPRPTCRPVLGNRPGRCRSPGSGEYVEGPIGVAGHELRFAGIE